jgi:crotonobetainyl-CoA:carnitine CoA-transferase CaiB-like acyl-CoA transferase
MDGDIRPLAGLLVVALEQAVAAPYCSSRLADAGARVIKIERVEGDFARGYDRFAAGESSYFAWLNRGKESLVVDIKDESDLTLLYRILDRADVFIQNLAPGAAARAGLSSAFLRARSPRLLTCDISGYGEVGEYAAMKAYDLLVQAESGLCSVTGSPEGPGRVGVSACDIACGMYAYMAVLEALIERERTGNGCAIDASLFSSVADWMTVPLLHYEADGKGPARVGLKHPSIHPYGAYPTRHGAPLLIAIQNEREFVRLCEQVLRQPAIPADPRFATNVERCKHQAELDELIVPVFVGCERAELIERLRQADIAFGNVNEVGGLATHPQLVRTMVGTPGGSVRLVSPPARFNATYRRLGAVPGIGEHSDAIRREFAA